MDVKKRPTVGGQRAHRSALEIEALVAKGRLRAKHGPKLTAHSHVLAAAFAHADAVAHGHVNGVSSSSGKLSRARPAVRPG